MTKVIIIIIVAVFGFLPVFSQYDTIVQKNGLRSAVKIVEMNKMEVRFSVPGEAESKINSLKHYSIDYVITKDGKKTKLEDLPEAPKEIKQNAFETLVNYKDDFSNHYVGIEMTKMIFASFSMNYRYVHNSGIWGVKIPLSYNLAPRVRYQDINGVFSANYLKYTLGLEFSLYPFKQKKVSYFVGPELLYGPFDYSKNYNWYYPYPYPNPPTEVFRDGYHVSFTINNGVLFRISDNIWGESAVGFGIQKNEMHKAGENIIPRFNMSLSMGYSF